MSAPRFEHKVIGIKLVAKSRKNSGFLGKYTSLITKIKKT